MDAVGLDAKNECLYGNCANSSKLEDGDGQVNSSQPCGVWITHGKMGWNMGKGKLKSQIKTESGWVYLKVTGLCKNGGPWAKL